MNQGETLDKPKQWTEQLWQRFLNEAHHKYSQNELLTAEQLLNTSVPFFRFIGRLIWMDANAVSRKELVTFIENECALGLEATKDYAHDLLFLQFGFSTDDLLRPPLKSFLFAAAQHDKVFCRQNAAHLLAKLAPFHKEALDALKQLGYDKNTLVRENAIALLKQIA